MINIFDLDKNVTISVTTFGTFWAQSKETHNCKPCEGRNFKALPNKMCERPQSNEQFEYMLHYA
jgi:hypothetical protein